MIAVLILAFFATYYVSNVFGHGMLMDPVGRGSRWRYDKTAPKNYDDNGNFCGGGAVSIFFTIPKRHIHITSVPI